MLFVALAIVATMTILLSFVFMNELGLRPDLHEHSARLSLCAMVFHTSAMFCFVFFCSTSICAGRRCSSSRPMPS